MGDPDFTDMRILTSIAFSAASSYYKPFTTKELLDGVLSGWNQQVVVNKGQNFLQIGPSKFLNVTLLAKPNLKYETISGD